MYILVLTWYLFKNLLKVGQVSGAHISSFKREMYVACAISISDFNLPRSFILKFLNLFLKNGSYIAISIAKKKELSM